MLDELGFIMDGLGAFMCGSQRPERVTSRSATSCHLLTGMSTAYHTGLILYFCRRD
jgi:hypothetical protein